MAAVAVGMDAVEGNKHLRRKEIISSELFDFIGNVQRKSRKRNDKRKENEKSVASPSAWSKSTNDIACRNHGKESTYLLCLHAWIREFQMASEWEMRWGREGMPWKRRRKQG